MSGRINVSVDPTRARLQGAAAMAYAAGLFDGEGCVHIARQRKVQSKRGYVLRLVVTVAQNHLNTLKDFQSMTGVEGRIYMRTRQGTANRDAYALNYDGEAAANLLEKLLPFLGRKADEAKVALKFQRETQINRHFGPKGCPDAIWRKRVLLSEKLRSLK